MFEILFSAAALCSFAAAAVLFGKDVQGGSQPIVIPTNAETLIVNGFAVTIPSATGKIKVRAWVQLQVGAGTNSIVLAIYPGSAIGANPVYTKQSQSGDFTPNSTATFSLECVIPYANITDANFCCSVTQNGATGNGTAQEYLIETEVLSG